MKTPLKIFIFILLLVLVVGTALYIYTTKTIIPKHKYEAELATFLNEKPFKDGDLILRRGKSFESFAVLMANREEEYSHIGIIKMEGENPWVLHASPEASKDSIDPIMKEALRSFLAYSKAREYHYAQLNNDYLNQGLSASHACLNHFYNKLTFDHQYDASDEKQQYCTEFIYHAYRKQGIDLMQQGMDTVNYFGRKQILIFPSSLIAEKKYFR